jgi:hypothetical protein
MVGIRSYTPKRIALGILLVLAVILVLVLLFAHENLHAIFRALSGANPILVAIAFGIYLLGVVFWAGRWKIALSRSGHVAGLRDLYLVVFGGIFVNNVTPLTYAGGDPIARVYLLKRAQRVPYSTGFATIISEFILDFPVFFSFIMLGLFLWVGVGQAWLALLLSGFWLLVLGCWCIFLRRVLGSERVSTSTGKFAAKIVGFFHKRARKMRIAGGVKKFWYQMGNIVRNPKTVMWIVSFSAILWLLGIIRLFVIFQALGYSPPLPMLVLAVTIPWLAGLIPLLPAGLGTVDAAALLIFMQFMPPGYYSVAVAAWMVERAVSFLFATTVGAAAFSSLGIRIWGGAGQPIRQK